MVPHVKEKSSMSWLSPKRRRTTGNLKTVATTSNGQDGQKKNDGDSRPTTPRASSPPARAKSSADRPPTTPTPAARPLSQPVLPSVLSETEEESTGIEHDGNLFYAYARKGDDLQSRYLLTFASASTANHWYSLLQLHFPNVSRPGPQLFSFTNNPPDLLQKAWKHPAFAHLKSKWMYIAFSDTTPAGLGGAAQGIIPVQDARGNLVAGSGGLSPLGSPAELGKEVHEVRKETKGMRNGMSKMEEHFERMMEAVERNTAQIALLAEAQASSAAAPKSEERNGYFDHNTRTGEDMSTYLSRINDLLAQHSDAMASLAQRQSESDQKLSSALEDLASKQRNDYLDMAQLSSHLDRVQTLMERSVNDRRDSARELLEQQRAAPAQIDLEPLTRHLEKVRDAVEQQSQREIPPAPSFDLAPLTERLDKLQDALLRPKQAPQIDLEPLTEHIEKMREAVEKQQPAPTIDFEPLSSRLDRMHETLSMPRDAPAIDLMPLTDRFDKLQEVLAKPKETPTIDLEPLTSRLDKVRDALQQPREATAIDFEPLSSRLDKVHDILSKPQEAPTIEFSPLTSRLEKLHETVSAQQTLDFSPLTLRLEKVQEAMEQNSALIKALLDEGTAPDSKPGTPFWGRDIAQQASSTVDLSPLTDHLRKIQEAIEAQSGHMQALVGFASGDGAGDGAGPASPVMLRGPVGERDLAPLGEHLEQIFQAIEEGNAHAKATRSAVEVANAERSEFDMAPLEEHFSTHAQHLKAIAAAADRSHGQMSELLSAHGELQKAVMANGEKPVPTLDLEPLIEKLEEMRAGIETTLSVDVLPLAEKFEDLVEKLAAISTSSRKGNEQMDELLKAHGSLNEAVVGSKVEPVDLGLLVEKMDDVRSAIELGGKLDLAPLVDRFEGLERHLRVMSASTEQQGKALEILLQAEDDATPSGPKLDLLAEHLEDIGVSAEQHNDHLQSILEMQVGIRSALTQAGGVLDKHGPLGGMFDGLSEHLKRIGVSTEQHNEHLRSLLQAHEGLRSAVGEASKPSDIDVAPLVGKFDGSDEHLKSISASTEQHNAHLRSLLQAQDGLRSAVCEAGKSSNIDLAPLIGKFDGLDEHLVSLREWAEHDSEQLKEIVEGQKAVQAITEAAAGQNQSVDLAPLTDKFGVLGEHLEAIRAATQAHSDSLRSLQTPPEIDLTPLTDRLNRIHDSLLRQADDKKTPGTGDAKFIMSALSSHLSMIQAVTEANAQHVRALREKQSATQDKMHISIANTSDAIAALNTHVGTQRERGDERIEAVQGQVRELMAGNREMVDAVRRLAEGITAWNKGQCDHIVVPPPRKVGRKIVGFVYEGKDGPLKNGVPAAAKGNDYWKGL